MIYLVGSLAILNIATSWLEAQYSHILITYLEKYTDIKREKLGPGVLLQTYAYILVHVCLNFYSLYCL